MEFKKHAKKITVLSVIASMCICSTACSSSSTYGLNKTSSAIEITEENTNTTLVMNNQPESSYWFPEQLLSWNAKEDKDILHNISHVPLAKRVDTENLQTVNETQNKDTKVMAISIMNSSTSGNAPHGLNVVDCNTFTYWQYVDMLVYWGGSSGEGLIVPPSPDVTDAAHKNGVPVIGTVFFPQDVAGGKIEWLDTFLTQDENKNFPMTDKLIEVAQTYGFDGWFINQETDNEKNGGLTPEYAQKMQEFIKQFKEKAPELELVWYDSMTKDGEMDWQNALTEKNITFMQDDKGNKVADDMFLNFWWTEDKYANEKLLEKSAELAKKTGIDPYDLYAGIDVQANGYTTPVKWDLFAKEDGTTYTSLGLYCPSWAYSSASDMEDFIKKETALWVNDKSNPAISRADSEGEQWRGVSSYVVERSAITSTPFVTNFSLGNGYSFFREGEQVSKLDWNNRSLSDILPTYRFIMEHEGDNELTATFDVANAWYGGNSLKLRGKMQADKTSEIMLYSADLPLTKTTKWTSTLKAASETQLNLVLTLDDGSKQVIKADKNIGEDWTTVSFDVSKLAGKNVRKISYSIKTAETSDNYELYFGNISVYEQEEIKNAEISNLKIDDFVFDEDAMYAGVRLSWESKGNAPYYEVYRINENNTRSLLGVSNTNVFYINTLPRTDDTNNSTFEVVPADLMQKQGKAIKVDMKWPDNSLPKADFIASKTFVAPNENITLQCNGSANIEEVSWSLKGASEEKLQGETVTVSYPKEGTYDVTISVKNKAGKDEKTIKGFIVVSNEATNIQNLSNGKNASASSYVNENEAPKFALDGDKTKKWCATGTPPHEIVIDLGGVHTVSEVVISHAEAGGESPDMNTKAYTISVSEDGVNYTEVVNITRNSLGETKDTFAPQKAKFVKLQITKPTQGSDSAARIYEVEVFGV